MATSNALAFILATALVGSATALKTETEASDPYVDYIEKINGKPIEEIPGYKVYGKGKMRHLKPTLFDIAQEKKEAAQFAKEHPEVVEAAKHKKELSERFMA